MVEKRIGRNAGDSGRVSVSGRELDQLGLTIGSSIEVDIAESVGVAQALIESKDADRFLIVSSTE